MKGRRGGRRRGATFYKDMRGAMAARDDGTTTSGGGVLQLLSLEEIVS